VCGEVWDIVMCGAHQQVEMQQMLLHHVNDCQELAMGTPEGGTEGGGKEGGRGRKKLH